MLKLLNWKEITAKPLVRADGTANPKPSAWSVPWLDFFRSDAVLKAPRNPTMSDAPVTDAAMPQRPPLTDSPWFWAYLFGTAALVALFLAGPRYLDRQPQLENRYLARQAGGQAVMGDQGPIEPSSRERMIISLRPLCVLLALLLTGAWAGLWYQRLRR